MQTLTTMKSLTVTGPGVAEFLETERPPVGPRDVAVKIKACGICGSDVFYVQRGGIPPRDSHTPLGHEPAGEIVEVGAEVQGAAVGDHVVINPMANRDGIIGNGGAQGALSDEVVLFDAEAGVHFRVIPDEVPWAVAALNEPMAVAYHGVNRSGAGEGSKVVVFGAGPVGLGAAIGFKSKGAAHVVVVDIQPSRLERALLIGADAVINSAEEDVAERLKELHGEVPGLHGPGLEGRDRRLLRRRRCARRDRDRAQGDAQPRRAHDRGGAQEAGGARPAGAAHHGTRHPSRDGVPDRDLRGDRLDHRALGQVPAHHQRHRAVRRGRARDDPRVDPRRGRQGRGRPSTAPHPASRRASRAHLRRLHIGSTAAVRG